MCFTSAWSGTEKTWLDVFQNPPAMGDAMWLGCFTYVSVWCSLRETPAGRSYGFQTQVPISCSITLSPNSSKSKCDSVLYSLSAAKPYLLSTYPFACIWNVQRANDSCVCVEWSRPMERGRERGWKRSQPMRGEQGKGNEAHQRRFILCDRPSGSAGQCQQKPGPKPQVFLFLLPMYTSPVFGSHYITLRGRLDEPRAALWQKQDSVVVCPLLFWSVHYSEGFSLTYFTLVWLCLVWWGLIYFWWFFSCLV